MRYYAGIDMREVGFPAFEQDTDYNACSGISMSYPTHLSRTSNPCDISSSSSSPVLLSKTKPTTLYVSPGFLGAFLNFDLNPDLPAQVSNGATASGLFGSLGGTPIWSGCSPGLPLLPPFDLAAGQNFENPRGVALGKWNNANYLDYNNHKSRTVSALHSYFMSDHYAGGISSSLTSGNAWRRVYSMLPSYELGAPVSRSIATLPNKFERTFSFLIDPHDDFDAVRILVPEDEGWEELTESAPAHKSNLYGFYATIELVDN